MPMKEYENVRSQIIDDQHHFTQELLDDMDYLMLDDSTKIIMFLQEREKSERRNWWKHLLINVASWFVGVLTALFVQY